MTKSEEAVREKCLPIWNRRWSTRGPARTSIGSMNQRRKFSDLIESAGSKRCPRCYENQAKKHESARFGKSKRRAA